jgi:hypothetical protein
MTEDYTQYEIGQMVDGFLIEECEHCQKPSRKRQVYGKDFYIHRCGVAVIKDPEDNNTPRVVIIDESCPSAPMPSNPKQIHVEEYPKE